MRFPYSFLLLFISLICYGQSLTGIVSDTLYRPLPNANIMALPSQKEAQLKFAITDKKVRYRLALENETKQMFMKILTKCTEKP